MKRWAFLFIFFIVCVLSILCIEKFAFCQDENSSCVLVADLQYEIYPGFSRIIFASNEKIDFISYELKNPYRIVIDLIGVLFCELEEHAEYSEGDVKSIDINRTTPLCRPEGLDEFFYAVDYIAITPASELPYTISSSEDGKIIVIDIGDKAPALMVSGVKPLGEEITRKASGAEELGEKRPEAEKPTESKQAPQTQEEKPPKKQPPQPSEAIIDYIDCETIDESSLVVISTNKEIVFEVYKRYYPHFDILLKPTEKLFTELEESIEVKDSYIRFLKIIKDTGMQKPPALDEYFYPVKEIIIEPTGDFPFDFYSSEDGTISIVEMYFPVVKEEQKQPPAPAETKPQPELEPKIRKELLKELKEDIKREGLLKEEKIAEFKKEEEESRRMQAEEMAQTIGKEVLKDLIAKGKGILDIRQAQDIALKNNPQANTSREEVKLAKLKKREASRALFPNVKLKGSHTAGDDSGLDFIEEVYGVEADHPLYQGFRLWNTYKQSKVNVNLAKARYQKVENDLYFKVADAYYATVTAAMNVRLQKELLREAEKILRLAEKRRESALSTNLEVLNVKSRYNQIQFQLATAERDLALSRFKLQQAMSLDIAPEKIDISEVDTDLQFKTIDIDLNRCLELAANNQPDLAVNQLLIESNRYGEKIAKGKRDFKIDLTGFYGRSDSYYETESRDLKKDWNIGIKISKPLWGMTPSYSFSKDRTSRKIGENTRTGETVNSGEIALFDKDALAVNSEIEEAKVNSQKAENDFIETRRNTEFEVKEAYYNYQEAVIQVKNSLAKVKFQEEGLKTAKAQAELNEALQSQQLEAMAQLADEKAVYIKALSDYNIALAKLNKAIGVKDYFSID